MKNSKKFLTLMLAFVIILASLPAMAYSPIAGGYQNAYYQGNEECPWKAEVTFERQWGGDVSATAKPLQTLSRNEKQIRANVFFSEVPADTHNAKIIAALYKNNEMINMTFGDVDTTKPASYVDMDTTSYIANDGAVYALRIFVWDGGFESAKPLTLMREISSSSCAVNAVTVDGTKYTHNADLTSKLFIDKELGIIEIDKSCIADISDVDLVIFLSYATGRTLECNGTKYSYDTEAGGFVLNDVDLTNGLPFTVTYGRSVSYYMINSPAKAEFIPDKMVFKESDGNLIERPMAGSEYTLGASVDAFDSTGTTKIADLGNVNFANSTYIDGGFDKRVYTSLYNDGGKLYYRMFSDGIKEAEIDSSDKTVNVFHSFINFVENARPESSYVFEIKFKAKAVPAEKYGANAVTDGVGIAPSVEFFVRNEDNKNIMQFASLKDGKFGYRGNVTNAPFFDKEAVKENQNYMIRVYARKLKDGTTSYRYYSYNKKNDCFLSHTVLSDSNSACDADWKSYDSPVYRLMLNINQSGYPSDIYVEHIKLYETKELTERFGGDKNKITDVNVAGLDDSSVTLDEENKEITVYVPCYDRSGNAISLESAVTEFILDDEGASIEIVDSDIAFDMDGVTRTARIPLVSGQKVKVTSVYGDSREYTLNVFNTINESFDDATPILQPTGEAVAGTNTIFKGIGDTASKHLDVAVSSVNVTGYESGMSAGYTDFGKDGTKAFFMEKNTHSGQNEDTGALRMTFAKAAESDYSEVSFDIRYEYVGDSSKNLFVSGFEAKGSSLIYRLGGNNLSYSETTQPKFRAGNTNAYEFVPGTTGTLTEWNNVKIQFYADEDGTRHTRLFVNGVHIEGADDLMEAKTAPKAYSFTLSSRRCAKIYVDNIRFINKVN